MIISKLFQDGIEIKVNQIWSAAGKHAYRVDSIIYDRHEPYIRGEELKQKSFHHLTLGRPHLILPHERWIPMFYYDKCVLCDLDIEDDYICDKCLVLE